MNCQKCRTPLKLDISLQDLNPAAFDLLVGSTGHSDDQATSTSRVPYPPERKDLYDQVAQDAASPVFKRAVPAARQGFGAQAAVAASTKAGLKDNPAMSFVMLTDSQLVPPQHTLEDYEGKQKKRDSKEAHNAANETFIEPKQTLSHQIESTTRLFEILSSRSDIDHPVCAECTDLLLSQLQSRLSASTRERDAYITFLKTLNNTIPSSSEISKAQTSLNASKAAESKAFSELLALEKEKAALDNEVATLEAESLALDEEEQAFWRSRNAFALTLSSFQNDRDALNAAYDHDAQQLERLELTNVYNDTFCIYHDGPFATINGLRLGRLPPQLNVDWPEINAAWGTAALLLATVAEKLGFTFRGYRIKPMGSTSRIEKLEQGSSTPRQSSSGRAANSASTNVHQEPVQSKVTALDLFSSGDLPLGRMLLHRRLDAGMVAFLECLRQLCDFVEQSSHRVPHNSNLSKVNDRGSSANDIKAAKLKVPYTITKDKIGDPEKPDLIASIKLGVSQDEAWTRACKYTLTCSNGLMAAPKDPEKERKKAEKLQKFNEKKAKAKATSAQATHGTSKTVAKKAKQDTSKDEPLPTYKEMTPPGERKILQSLNDPHHMNYIPKVVESGWYDWWEKEGYFEPEFGSDGNVKKQGYFVIPEPPPNVTGALHMGHALPNALQDSLIRWNRMRGLTTLWLPGCDHAGISTQTVVEKMLMRLEGKTRYDLGREALVERIWEWKEQYHRNINGVLRRMGGSFDWTREAFTMNSTFSAAVTETFVTLHDEGLIYRANRLVNWCTALNTTLSNLEVDNLELKGRTMLDIPGYKKKIEFGVITHFLYQVDGSEETIEVATTRPETMLGDTGIAVHPKDERYKHLVGKRAIHPFLERRMPIVADEYADPEKGTGAVKITPAHDFNDFEVGRRNGLEFINILNDNGTLNGKAGDFEGMQRFDARYKVIEALKAKGLYVKWENNEMKVPRCQKSKDVIEPIMKPQWWLKMKDGLAPAAIEAVRSGQIKIRPESAEKNYYSWMENINDWCLSRQLWWGHQAPAYFINIEGESGDESDGELWVVGRTEEAAEEKARTKFPGKSFTLTRDPDVLDTWFSSGLWPFATLGWPNKTHDLETLYPTSVLETGWDILFFWVARMIMFGIKMTGQIPFREVYCHSLVRDSEGRKMSKSLGNVIDPLDVMEGISLSDLHKKLEGGNLDPKEVAKATKTQETAFPEGIPECGADALRFSLVNYTTGGGDINFDIKVMQGYRKFCNKIYQATKYVLGKLDSSFVPQKLPVKTGQESLAELWILHKFNTAAADIHTAFTQREFSQATSITYQYWYNQLCDVYIENSKAIIQSGTPSEQESAKQTLYTALEGALTMIHPFMPFITEELWQRLPRRPEDQTPSIVKAAYPQYNPELDDRDSEEAYELIMSVAKGIRQLAAEYFIKDSATVSIQLFTPAALSTCKSQIASIKSLSGKAMLGEHASISILSSTDSKPAGCVAQSVSASAAVYLLVKGRIDIEAEIKKGKEKLAAAREGMEKKRKMVGGEGWEKMREDAQETERRKLANAEQEVKVLEGSVEQFERLRLE